MTHHYVWRLRNLYRRLLRSLRDEGRKPRPDSSILKDLQRRREQLREQLFMAEAGLVPVRVRTDRR